MELLNHHVTIRRFKDKPVDDLLLNNLLYSGTRASTTGNMQLYSVILTRDKSSREKLAPLHFNQPAATTAPVLLTVVADFNRFSKWCMINNAHPGYDNFLSFFNAAIDAILVAQNICIAAENSGLGICYLGTTTYNAPEIIKLLQLPRLTFPVTTLALGYPNESPSLTDRIPLEGVVHSETYTDYADSAIKQLYSFKESLSDSMKFIKENNKESLAQVYTDVRYKKSDNIFFSDKMLNTLREQGFTV